MTRLLLLLVGLAMLVSPLSGCGRKGAPRPPGPADQIIYPKSYPTQ